MLFKKQGPFIAAQRKPVRSLDRVCNFDRFAARRDVVHSRRKARGQRLTCQSFLYGFGLGSVQARVRKVNAAFLIDDQIVGATERHSFEIIGDNCFSRRRRDHYDTSMTVRGLDRKEAAFRIQRHTEPSVGVLAKHENPAGPINFPNPVCWRFSEKGCAVRQTDGVIRPVQAALHQFNLGSRFDNSRNVFRYYLRRAGHLRDEDECT